MGAWMSKGKSGEHLQSTAPRIHPAPAARVDAVNSEEKSKPEKQITVVKKSYTYLIYSTDAFNEN